MRITVEEGAKLIKQGEIVAFPTETVYGLGASVFHQEAIQKIFLTKGRPQDNPLIVHISSLNQLSLVAKHLPEKFEVLAEHFFPGPLTVVLPKHENVPQIVSAGLSTVGIRMPNHPIARRLIELVGEPLVAPSANLSGKPSSTTAQHVLDDFGSAIGGVIEGGECEYGIESTVILLTPIPTILRPGSITKEQLEEVLKNPVACAEEHSEIPLSPGMKYRHYAPKAKLFLFDTEEEIKRHIQSTPLCSRIIIHSFLPKELYTFLRKADSENKDEILILCTPAMKKNSSLMNRILRASQ